ncbi:MAG: ribonuclease R [Verrucomicrobiales bacterium]|jgi:ribonuclease R
MKAKERLRKLLIKHLKGANYQAQDNSELQRTLDIESKERKLFRSILKELEADGRIKQGKKGRYSIRKKGVASSSGGGEIIGTIRFQERGDAFVTDESQGENSRWILIPAKYTGIAMDRDRVSIALDSQPEEKPWLKNIKDPERRKRAQAGADRQQGRVVKVIERKRSNVVGTYRSQKKFDYVQPDSVTLPPSIELKRDELPDPAPKDGEKVVVTIDSWTSRDSSPRGHIIEVLGMADTPGVDILSIIHKHNLPLDFPDEVNAEVAEMSTVVTKKDLKGREDWRDRDVFTIDPKDAKDFDDAIMVERLEDGGWELAVHIADVSHYVQPRTELDREAQARGNSVYLVDRVIPMLPEALSNGLCSLKPDVDRLTRAAIIRFDKDGHQTAVRFISAVICSKKRLTYEEAIELIKSEEEDHVTTLVKTAWELASLLRKRRFENGGLDLDFPEVKVELDEKGKPIGLVRIDYDESHQLIEEFMLIANEAVAKATKDRLAASIYRIHEDPDADKLNELRENVRTYGIRVGDLTNRDEVQKLLEQSEGMHEEHAIKIALLRSLKRAAYSEIPVGHYGLAKVNYTHFTSPIRRYADLIVHRVLGRLMAPTDSKKFKTPKLAKIKDIAARLSVTERTAAEAEKATRKLKELEYFAGLAAQKDGSPTFRATVIDVRRMGVFIELSDYFIGGLVRLGDLPDSDEGGYFDSGQNAFFSRNPKWRIGIGDELEVTVARVDIEQNFLDFRVLGSSGKKHPQRKRPKKSTSSNSRSRSDRSGSRSGSRQPQAEGGDSEPKKKTRRRRSGSRRRSPRKSSEQS